MKAAVLSSKRKLIVLLTTTQPSINPRIVKEADALAQAGFKVKLLYCYCIKWASATDEKLLANANWEPILIGGTPTKHSILFYFTKIKFRINNFLNKHLGNRYLLAERSQARCYDELLRAAKMVKADWYIGHNLGTLAIAVKAAQFNSASAGFDFEDYHRGELHEHEKGIFKRVLFLENKYLRSLQYFSTASEHITLYTQKNHRHFEGVVITLLNCFPLRQQVDNHLKASTDKDLQLFWFSQKIGINRGLEVIIHALKGLNDPTVHLTLAGNCTPEMLDYITDLAGPVFNNIHLVGIIPPEDLPAFAARFDIGLALELPILKNRELCLTNKIFTYLLAGNAVLISETPMQLAFNTAYKIGESFAANDEKQLMKKILLYKDSHYLNRQKKHNHQLAKNELNWEKESQKLLAIIQ